MGSRWEPRAGLDYEVARRLGIPAVQRALSMLEDEAKARAPGVKVWVTMRDERVRPSHVDADAQAVPANLRFRLRAADGTIDLARHPRDPELPVDQRANCRCDDPTLPALLRDSIHTTPVTITGNRVSGHVETRFPRAAESEFGGGEDEPAHFMTGALHEVARRLRAGHAR